jgi:hypothetical protein
MGMGMGCCDSVLMLVMRVIMTVIVRMYTFNRDLTLAATAGYTHAIFPSMAS